MLFVKVFERQRKYRLDNKRRKGAFVRYEALESGNDVGGGVGGGGLLCAEIGYC